MMYLPQMMIKVSTHLEFCLMLICSWHDKTSTGIKKNVWKKIGCLHNFQENGLFGYDCEMGRCDLMLFYPDSWTIEKIFDQIIVIIAFTLILISYSYLGWYFWRYYRHLKVLDIKSQIEFKTTWTLFILFIFNAIISGLPWLLDLLRYHGIYNESVYLSFLFLYVTPYGFAIFIYLSIIQYRKAYAFILKKALVKNHKPELTFRQNTEAGVSSISFGKVTFNRVKSYFD